jgi:ribosome-associated protein
MIGTEEPTFKQKCKLQLCYNAVVDKKANDVIVLDLRGLTSVADFFIICHGTSSRQVLAIADNLESALRDSGMKQYHTEGREEGSWVLMDASDIIIHVFHEPKRSFYMLEKLWADAAVVDNSKIVEWGEGE